jgi:hypothetical protein
MNAAAVAPHLLAAVGHARHASARVQAMVRNAIAAFMARLAIAEAATC